MEKWNVGIVESCKNEEKKNTAYRRQAAFVNNYGGPSETE